MNTSCSNDTRGTTAIVAEAEAAVAREIRGAGGTMAGAGAGESAGGGDLHRRGPPMSWAALSWVALGAGPRGLRHPPTLFIAML